MLNPIFGMLTCQLESDPKHARHARLSLIVKKLDAIKICGFAKSGNTADVTFTFPPIYIATQKKGMYLLNQF